jgi:hypothetical protein
VKGVELGFTVEQALGEFLANCFQRQDTGRYLDWFLNYAVTQSLIVTAISVVVMNRDISVNKESCTNRFRLPVRSEIYFPSTFSGSAQGLPKPLFNEYGENAAGVVD